MGRPKKAPRKRLSLTLTPEEKQNLRLIAENEGCLMHTWVRQIVTESIENKLADFETA